MAELLHLDKHRDTKRSDAIAALAQHSLFSNMPEDIFAEFSSAAQVLDSEKGQMLFLQDDPSEWFYFVVSGWIKLFRETVDGGEAVLDVLTSGHIFGEAAILDGGMHTVGAAVVEKTVLLRLPATILKNAIAKNHKVALGMLASVSRQRRQQTQDIEKLSLQNTSQRIGCFLLRMCKTSDVTSAEFKLPYDKSLIAARLGMQCETFSRALNKLRKETSITVKGSSVGIPDVSELAAFSCSNCSQEFPCHDLH